MEIEILIVDDDPIFHLMISNLLKNLGVSKIKSILDPKEGLNYLLTHKDVPDILFLDINMPKLSGWQLLDSLNNSKVDLLSMKIYIVTSSIDKYDKDKSKEYNIVNFLNKPLKPNTLRKIVVEF
ncbi:CheY-like chemotaxis protein [Leeuwenhoekiella aestuarii]|uniref:CheY-like chemotaxis protein n=1 Tax=Leeuwenhoekiella aestuarii TaxID=2249426 RepID=A0A4Q0NYA1_9FLAO|nr:response regulator [Leeuwenhoekiella aestuarii]RXG15955.1 CheY-like chemotaxis protein [Leeuwenhoekiella aestuarii]RXG16649.1 CheY-like chemotaxis protein [Leeuwenhoekiella aestuarii]